MYFDYVHCAHTNISPALGGDVTDIQLSQVSCLPHGFRSRKARPSPTISKGTMQNREGLAIKEMPSYSRCANAVLVVLLAVMRARPRALTRPDLARRSTGLSRAQQIPTELLLQNRVLTHGVRTPRPQAPMHTIGSAMTTQQESSCCPKIQTGWVKMNRARTRDQVPVRFISKSRLGRTRRARMKQHRPSRHLDRQQARIVTGRISIIRRDASRVCRVGFHGRNV